MQIHHDLCTLIDINDRSIISKVKIIPKHLFRLKFQYEKNFLLEFCYTKWWLIISYNTCILSITNFLDWITCLKKNIFLVLPFVNIFDGVCETHEIGKKHVESFPTGKSWRARKMLEINYTFKFMQSWDSNTR